MFSARRARPVCECERECVRGRAGGRVGVPARACSRLGARRAARAAFGGRAAFGWAIAQAQAACCSRLLPPARARHARASTVRRVRVRTVRCVGRSAPSSSVSACGSLPHMYEKKSVLSFSSRLTSCAWSVSNLRHCARAGTGRASRHRDTGTPGPTASWPLGARRAGAEWGGARRTTRSLVTFSTSLPSQCRYFVTYRVCGGS